MYTHVRYCFDASLQLSASTQNVTREGYLKYSSSALYSILLINNLLASAIAQYTTRSRVACK